jgi:hypothetical protein
MFRSNKRYRFPFSRIVLANLRFDISLAIYKQNPQTNNNHVAEMTKL